MKREIRECQKKLDDAIWDILTDEQLPCMFVDVDCVECGDYTFSGKLHVDHDREYDYEGSLVDWRVLLYYIASGSLIDEDGNECITQEILDYFNEKSTSYE